MELARQVASLGLAARNSAGLKVRQPLARALAYAGGKHTLTTELVEIITDELNVKQFEFVEQASQLVTLPVFCRITSCWDRALAHHSLRCALALLAATRTPSQPTSRPACQSAWKWTGRRSSWRRRKSWCKLSPAEGLAVAADKLVTVAVDATITPELRAEGLAREVVRRIQAMRKEAGFDISDRITTYYQASGEFCRGLPGLERIYQSETL